MIFFRFFENAYLCLCEDFLRLQINYNSGAYMKSYGIVIYNFEYMKFAELCCSLNVNIKSNIAVIDEISMKIFIVMTMKVDCLHCEIEY